MTPDFRELPPFDRSRLREHQDHERQLPDLIVASAQRTESIRDPAKEPPVGYVAKLPLSATKNIRMRRSWIALTACTLVTLLAILYLRNPTEGPGPALAQPTRSTTVADSALEHSSAATAKDASNADDKANGIVPVGRKAMSRAVAGRYASLNVNSVRESVS